ncbi:dihydrofolate reductase family protein [Rossellomorea vietnamensis]|uniref:dihydrofolate reductase family protein n=1 Tax=Rossellomorea vietnamensis TaxID=218284 RepID=UPI001CCD35C9|nr:dihydrofolate reductase family protein [Rossellomorea vietnamensis]MCA0151044.1 dihydrofolate reductase family protein [Rossellomorea vietnamensis]
MCELIYHVAVSLDHFIADQALIDGDIERSLFLFDGDHVPEFLEDIKGYDAVLMGRKTYEFGFLLGAKPGEPGYKGIKHYIFSKSLQFDSNEEVELIKEDAVSFIQNLKQQEKGRIWLCGGGELAGTLLKHQLLDRLILKVNPILVGKGTPLFGSEELRVNLKLLDVKPYASGVIRSEYTFMYS